jgi:hypothetical protein
MLLCVPLLLLAAWPHVCTHDDMHGIDADQACHACACTHAHVRVFAHLPTYCMRWFCFFCMMKYEWGRRLVLANDQANFWLSFSSH